MSWTLVGNIRGPTGAAGAVGATGLSAYQLAVEEGYSGTLEQWLASLVGAPGGQGATGAGLEYDWNGTELGVRVEGDPSYSYVDLEGPAGQTGQAGADGTPQWQGAWTAGTYQAGEAVSHAGSSFVANTSTSQEPPHADWDVLAAKGDAGSGGASDWGDIGGTLSDQTDLQNALDAKADESSLADVATTGAYADLSGRPSLGTAAAANTGDFATAAQGGKADTALQPGDELTDLASTGVTAGHVPKADGSGGISWAAESGGGGASAFTGLTDTPASYSGQGGKAVTVNSGETGLEFTTPTGGDLVVVQHGANPSITRPVGAPVVYWMGSIAPTNRQTGDLWLETGAYD